MKKNFFVLISVLFLFFSFNGYAQKTEEISLFEIDRLIKDTEYDVKTDKSLHADFHIVSGQKKFTFVYKIRYSGTAAGVLKGGFMVKHVPEIKVKALPQDLPEFISADVSKLEIGQKFTIADFNLGDKIEVLSDPAALVVSIAPPKK